MKVTIYSTPTCPFCQQAKDFFKENNVEFEDINVADDEKAAQKMIDLTGQMSVPQIMVGEEVVIGFDKPKLQELLGLK